MSEMDKLRHMLEESHIPYDYKEHYTENQKNADCYLSYPCKGEREICSVISTTFSEGRKLGLLEIRGLMTEEEKEFDNVLGYLNSREVYRRIAEHWGK